MNQRIALYLSGQYPGNYRLPNRLDILLKIRQLDQTNFNDTTINLLQGKSDGEYFGTLLTTFESLHIPEEYKILLDNLNIPEWVRRNPYEKISSIENTTIDLQKISSFLDKANEEVFSRFVVMPILQAMWYEEVEYKWKVNESDGWIDFYAVKYKSPIWQEYYSWIQVKSCKMTSGSQSKPWAELVKLVQEVTKAFQTSHIINTWEHISLSEVIVFNSYDTPESVKESFFKTPAFVWQNIKFYSKDWILSLISSLDFKKDFFSNLK